VAIFLLLHGDHTIYSLLSETRHFLSKYLDFLCHPWKYQLRYWVKSTVYRRVMCLFRLQKETFEGLSQEALSVCIRTLKFASSQIATKTVRIKQGMFFWTGEYFFAFSLYRELSTVIYFWSNIYWYWENRSLHLMSSLQCENYLLTSATWGPQHMVCWARVQDCSLWIATTLCWSFFWRYV
jgi:hypothetical protein